MQEAPDTVFVAVVPNLDLVYVSGKTATITFDKFSGAIRKYSPKSEFLSSNVESKRPRGTSWNFWIQLQVPKIRERFSIPSYAKWKVKPTRGTPVLEFYQLDSKLLELSDANRAIVTFDNSSGLVGSFSQSWGHKFGPSTPQISAVRAQKIGLEHYCQTYAFWLQDGTKLAIGTDKHGKRFSTEPPLVKLAFVLPDSAHRSLVPFERKGEIRLAYVVPCGHETVWVDARNGSILGGTMCR